MTKRVGALIVSILLLSGCNPVKLSADEQQQIDALKQALVNTKKDISLSNDELNKYSGELIHQLISTRLGILQENRYYLQQRIDVVETAVNKGTAFPRITTDEQAVNSLSKMISDLQKEITTGRQDAAQEPDGPILAISLSAIAWQEQVLARVQQRYLEARFTMEQDAQPETETEPLATERLFPPANGPFGFLAGLSKKNIEEMTGKALVPVQGQREVYHVGSSPKPSGEFGDFLLRISPKAGLCQIKAIGKNIATDEYGISLKGKFNEISNMLSATYGKGQKTDRLNPDSAWQAPQEWMMGLYNRERELRMEWHSLNNSLAQKQLQGVDVEALTNNPAAGYVALQYTFRNNSVCAAEIKM